MIKDFISIVKGWWSRMFDYNKIIKDFNLDIQTSREILDAIQKWSQIFNGHEPWIDDNTQSLHVAKTICEKVSEAVVVEFKSSCDDPYIDKVYQKFLKKLQTDTECMLGKSLIFFRPYYDGKNIKVNHIQADKFIPIKISDDGELLACIIIDQITKQSDVYTRLEYNNLVNGTMHFKSIAYKGRKDGVILSSQINLSEVDEWKNIIPEGEISGIDRLIGGFATMRNVNPLDNDSAIGAPIYHNALDTLKEIDKQWSRTLWEYEGSELAVDADITLLKTTQMGFELPKGKERLFRTWNFDDTKDKTYNIFSPEIRDTSLFNGLNEFLRKAEVQCHLEHGTLSKTESVEKSATEAKQLKQSYYVTISNIQSSLQTAIDDLIYGIYVLCKLYKIPVKANYTVEYDWGDSVLKDKDAERNQALLERNNGITSDVQYIMETRRMKEKDAIAFVKKQKEYRALTEDKRDDIDEE